MFHIRFRDDFEEHPTPRLIFETIADIGGWVCFSTGPTRDICSRVRAGVREKIVDMWCLIFNDELTEFRRGKCKKTNLAVVSQKYVFGPVRGQNHPFLAHFRNEMLADQNYHSLLLLPFFCCFFFFAQKCDKKLEDSAQHYAIWGAPKCGAPQK